MDTKPIFDFLNELEFRTRYKRPPINSTRMKQNHSKIEYSRVLESMEREFEACLFQCMTEDANFKTEVIGSRLNDIIHDLEECLQLSPLPFGLDREAALAAAKDCLKYLYVRGFVKPHEEALSTRTTTGGINIDKSKIDWSKPVYTAEEVKTLLGVSDTTFRRWLNGGWIPYTQMDGSDKKFIQKEHLLAFLNNEKIFYPSAK